MNNSRETEQNRKERDSNQIKQGTETRYYQQTAQGRKDTHQDRQRKKRPFISRNMLIALSVLVMLYCLLNLAGRIFIGPKHVPGTKGVEVYGIDEAGKRRIEQHLKEKYGEEFVCDKAYNNSNEFLFQRYKFGEHYEVHNKETGEEFHVFGFNYKGTKSGYEYRDGYFAVQNRERYEKYVQNVIQESFDGTCYVKVGIYDRVYNNQINKDTPIEDLFELTKDGNDVFVRYKIWIPESEIRDAQELNQKQLEVARILKKHKLLGYVRAYVIIEGKEEEFVKYIAGKTDGKFSEKDFFSKKYRTEDDIDREGVWWYDVERNKKDSDKIDIRERRYHENMERIVE